MGANEVHVLGSHESDASPQGEVHWVKTGPIHWLDYLAQFNEHRDWLRDREGHNGLTGTWNCNVRAQGELRYIYYFFDNVDTAFKFKMRWA